MAAIRERLVQYIISCCPTLCSSLLCVPFWPKLSRHQSVISKATSSCFLTNRTDLDAHAPVLFVCLHLKEFNGAMKVPLKSQKFAVSSSRSYSGGGTLTFVLTHPVIWLKLNVKNTNKISDQVTETQMNTTRTITYRLLINYIYVSTLAWVRDEF